MARPRDLPIVDLMAELPEAHRGMGLNEARRPMNDADSALPLRDHVWEPFLAGNARRVDDTGEHG